jgi:hypothetical protein
MNNYDDDLRRALEMSKVDFNQGMSEEEALARALEMSKGENNLDSEYHTKGK